MIKIYTKIVKSALLPMMILSLIGIHSVVNAANKEEYKIKNIVFVGNKHFSDIELLSLMQTKRSLIFRPSTFNKNVLKHDLNRIQNFYQSEGYLKAVIENYRIKIDSLNSEISLIITINENELYTIGEIFFIGNEHLDDNFLRRSLPISRGDAFKNLSIERAKIELTTLYQEKGFSDVQIFVRYDSTEIPTELSLSFRINEGTHYKIGKIIVKGLVKTKKDIVTRELRFKSGEDYSPQKIIESQKYLYRTGLFYSINIKDTLAANGDSTKKDIIFSLEEAEAGEFEVGLGYGSVEKMRLTSSISYINFFGRSYRGKILGRLSFLEHRLETTLTDPWFFGFPVEAALGFEIARDNQPSYDLFYYNSKVNFLKEFDLKSRTTLLFEYGNGKYTDIKLDFYDNIDFDSLGIADSVLIDLLKNLNYNIDRNGVKWSVYRDYRDNIFDPRKGNYLDASIQYIYGKANLTFYKKYNKTLINHVLKFTANYRYYWSVSENGVLASSFDFGIMDFFNSSKINFLLSDLFYAGGPNSLRGFGYREIGPKDLNGIAIGGKLKVVWNALEYRYKFLTFLDGAFFIDVGNIWSSYKDFNLKDIRLDYGTGLRVSSPIGLVRFDFALNPFPQGDEAKYQFWFGIGQAF
jgi:outer membrane protein insertion porin family